MKKLFITLAGLIALIPASRAQNNVDAPVAKGEAFYYYHNEKVRLKPVNDVLFVSFADKNKFEKAKQLPSNYKSELQKLNESTDFHQPLNAIRFKVNKTNLGSDEKVQEFADQLKSRTDVAAVYPAYLNGKDTVYVGDKIMFELKNEADRGMIEQKLKLSNGAITGTFNMGDHNQYEASISKEFNVFDVTNNLVEKGLVKFAHPNMTFTAHSHFTPNDSYYSSQSFLTAIDAPQAWGITKGNSNVIVAVMDGDGFDMSHQEMAGKYIYPMDVAGTYVFLDVVFYDLDPSPNNSFENHGTPCVGLIAALTNNNNGVASVGFNIKVMPIRIGWNTQPNGSFTTSEWAIALASDWVINHGQVHAVSNSWGTTQYSASMESSINSMTTNARGGKGAVVFASTGDANDGGAVLYPASFASVEGVGGSAANDLRSSSSNYGNIVDIVAPAVSYTIDRRGSVGYTSGNYTNYSGTSAACPIATAIVGLLASVKPDLTATEYKNIIFQSCEKVGGYSYNSDPTHTASTWNNEMGYGRVNAYNALLKFTYLTPNYSPATVCTLPQSISIPFTTSLITFNTGNVFTAQLSDASGSFAIPKNIGSITTTSSGTISGTLPAGLGVGNGYRIRIKSSNPVIISAPGTKIGIGKAPVDVWARKSDLGSARRGSVGFSIGTKGYIGTGKMGSTYYNDFWEFDQATNTWTQKANFPATARYGASGFSIGTKGYIGTGFDATNSKTDFWEWDQATNIWTKKANFPGTARGDASAFSIGAKGYLGTGYDGNYKTDFYEYDPSTNVWTEKTHFSGTGRYGAVGFSIGTKGYIGTGLDGSVTNTFYEYNPTSDTWSQKTSLPGSARRNAIGFSIADKGYIGAGRDNGLNCYNDFWEYNQSNNTWAQKGNFGGAARYRAVGFSIGSKGYIGSGSDSLDYEDFWEYEPAAAIFTQSLSAATYCAGTSVSVPFTAYGTFGSCTGNTFTAQLSDPTGSFSTPTVIGSFTGTTNGTIPCTIPSNALYGTKYRIRVVSTNPVVAGANNGTNIKIKTIPAIPDPISGNSSVCSGDVANYSITPVMYASNYQWLTPTGNTIQTGQGTPNLAVQWSGAAGNLKVRAQNSCGSSAYRTLAVNFTCREEAKNNISGSMNYGVFPNPTKCVATLRFVSVKNESYEIKITDISGKQIISLNGNATEGINELPVDLSKYDNGIYFLNIITSDGVQTKKLIKE